ncbi:MAG: hypothetical protein ACKV19_23260 [Verrucomicrobiales bacterium]
MSSAAAASPQSPEAAPLSGWARRLDLYGVFWVRFLDFGVRRCPFFIEPLLVAGYTLFFFAVAGRQRQAVMENLRVLCPGAGRLGRWLRAYRVFWEFAWMVVDAARARSGERHVTWRLDGAEPFRAAREGRGVLLLTAHMGNYDVAGPFFAEKFGRTMHGVRRPERRVDLQEYMETQRQALTPDGYRVQYNTEGGFLAVELAQALAAGEVVAIQADRVAEDMGMVQLEWRGRLWRLPSGPLVLAQVTGAPLYPVFSVRDSWRSYRVLFLPGWATADPPRDRVARQAMHREMARWWANTLAGVLERHWALWLMFEPAFAALPNVARDSPLPTVEPAPVPRSPLPQRPERTTPTGWKPTLQPISRTYLGRWLNARGFFLPAEGPHQLRAEDSAQNWVEVVVLSTFSGLLAAAAVWMALAAWLPVGLAAALAPVAWFVLLHLVPLACGAAAGFCKRLPMVPARWSVMRLSEEFLFGAQTVVAAAWLVTPFRWLGVAWLLFAGANALCFVCLSVLGRGRDGRDERDGREGRDERDGREECLED